MQRPGGGNALGVFQKGREARWSGKQVDCGPGELHENYGRVFSFAWPGYNFYPKILWAVCNDSGGEGQLLRLGWPRGPISSSPLSPCSGCEAEEGPDGT